MHRTVSDLPVMIKVLPFQPSRIPGRAAWARAGAVLEIIVLFLAALFFVGTIENALHKDRPAPAPDAPAFRSTALPARSTLTR
jgi:hypothetical protein